MADGLTPRLRWLAKELPMPPEDHHITIDGKRWLLRFTKLKGDAAAIVVSKDTLVIQ